VDAFDAGLFDENDVPDAADVLGAEDIKARILLWSAVIDDACKQATPAVPVLASEKLRFNAWFSALYQGTVTMNTSSKLVVITPEMDADLKAQGMTTLGELAAFELVLALGRAAGLEAGCVASREPLAEVGAADLLQQVAAERGLGADLRRGEPASGPGEAAVALEVDDQLLLFAAGLGQAPGHDHQQLAEAEQVEDALQHGGRDDRRERVPAAGAGDADADARFNPIEYVRKQLDSATQAQRQRDDAHRDAGAQVGEESLPVVALQRVEQPGAEGVQWNVGHRVSGAGSSGSKQPATGGPQW
jgi:hypothetical protein